MFVGGRCTICPIELKIQVMIAECVGERSGVEVAITVMDSRTTAAVLGMARTILQRFDEEEEAVVVVVDDDEEEGLG